MGAVLREQNALPTRAKLTIKPTAKAAIDNCRAGRAAKGENPSLCAKKIKQALLLVFIFWGQTRVGRTPELSGVRARSENR